MGRGALLDINAWTRKTEAAKKRITTKATVYVQKNVRTILREAATVSPQWSGNFVANWVVETKQTGFGVAYTNRFKVNPWWSIREHVKTKDIRPGHVTAIAWVMQDNEDVIQSIKWNSKIRLTNAHPLVEEIAAGMIHLRPQSYAYGEPAVYAHLAHKFKYVRAG